MNYYKSLGLLLSLLYITSTEASISPLTHDLKSIHPKEVNTEWKAYKHYLNTLDTDPVYFDSETDRIQFHFEHVYNVLSTVDLSHFDLSQKIKRREILGYLNDYRSLKDFPKNYTVESRNPSFIDQNNTHCAVAYLLNKTEDQTIIDHIVAHHNDDFIKNMKSAELLSWADEHGFTIDELALIQPSYPSVEYAWEVWGNGQGIDGRVNVMTVAPDDSFMIVAGNFSNIDGIDAQNIIAYDGIEWISMSGLSGVVEDVAIDEDNQVFAAGELFIDGVQVNLATYQNTEWIPLIKETNGTIYTIQLHRNKLFVGGDFEFIDSIACANLAYYDLENSQWSIDGEDGTHGVFSTDGVVRDMDITVLDTLVVGGSFSRTGILSNADSINLDTCYNLSFWNGNGWEHNYSYENIPEVHCLSAEYGLQIGGDMREDYSLAYKFYVEDWKDYNSLDIPQYTYTEEPLIQGFIGGFAYGNIVPDVFVGESSYNLVHCGYSWGSGRGINKTDGTITAAASLQGYNYFAGTFTHMEDLQTNGLAKTDGTSHNHEIQALDLEIYCSFGEMKIKGELKKDSELTILNDNGQSVFSQSLTRSIMDEQVSLSSLSSGVYYIYINNDTGSLTKKVVIMN